MKIHPYAEAFPRMEGKDFDDFCADIKANGLKNSIILLDGAILDGLNRQRACDATGVLPRYEQFANVSKGELAHDYVWSQNAHRRHLSQDQKFSAWDKLHTMAAKAQEEFIAAEAKRKQSEAAKQRPRNEDGTLSSQSQVVSPETGKTHAKRQEPPAKASRDSRKEPTTRKAKAKAAGVTEHTVKQVDTIKRIAPERAPEILDRVIAGKTKLVDAVREVLPTTLPKPRPIQSEVDSAVNAVHSIYIRIPSELKSEFKSRFQEKINHVFQHTR